MTIRLRLTILLAVTFSLLLVGFGLGVYLVLSVHLHSDIDAALVRSGRQLAFRLQSPTRASDPSLIRVLDLYPHNLALTFDAAGSEIAGSPSASGLVLHVPAAAMHHALSGGSTLITVKQGVHYRLDVIPLTRSNPAYVGADGSIPRVLVVAESLSSVDSFLSTLRLILLAAGGLALISAAGVGWVVVSNGLSPMTALTQAAERLGQGSDLSRRLPDPGTKDEVARLTAAFNDSLERLERTYRSLEEALLLQRQFVADASHELRTPLTVMLTNAETLLDHPQMPASERQRGLGEIRAEVVRMAELSASLLQLAKGDSGSPIQSEEMDWDLFLAEAATDARRICAPRPVESMIEAPLGTGRGERDALLGVLRALFDNIARHTAPDAPVRLVAGADATTIRLQVQDAGAGVEPHNLPHIFDRFYRAEPSRHGHGTGLGLAIARSVIERHGGTITADNAPGGGLVVRVVLPRFVASKTVPTDGTAASG
ncbi:MAG TPA: ATP-binding protein [Candidatus Nitrosotalea sp.]|nr:ATP-binding protein [Candidatus Nitrosotalea sp.]